MQYIIRRAVANHGVENDEGLENDLGASRTTQHGRRHELARTHNDVGLPEAGREGLADVVHGTILGPGRGDDRVEVLQDEVEFWRVG